MNPLELPRALVDFETFSEIDLKAHGAVRYAEHSSTEVLCMGYKLPGKKTKLWVDPKVWELSFDQIGMMEQALGKGVLVYGEFPLDLRKHIESGGAVEAHNAPFELSIFYRLLHKRYGIPYPKHMIDTMATCANRSLPLSLDEVGKELNLDTQKDKEGKKYLQLLCKPRKPTKKDPSTRSYDFSAFVGLCKYCVKDVDTEEALAKAIGDLTLNEYAVWVLDQKINNRGVMVDLDAVYKAKLIVDEVYKKMELELSEITGGTVTSGGEVAKIVKWCQNNGLTGLADLQAQTVDDMLSQGWIPDDVRRVLEIRQELSRASNKKLTRFIDCTSADSRVRYLLQYHGAGRTGRWAGRLIQPQNFPRGFDFKFDMDVLIANIKYGVADILDLLYGSALQAVSSALRGNFISGPGRKLYVADFASIEARVVMWLAGQEDALQAFIDADAGTGADIYCIMATEIYQRPITKKDKGERQTGKVVVLGCGYQMSGTKLATQSEPAMAMVGLPALTIEEANAHVSKFRSKFYKLPELWRGLEDAAIDCVRHKTAMTYGMIRFEYVEDNAGPWMAIVLPNGRRLWYYKPGLEERTVKYRDKFTGEEKTFTKDQLYYRGRDNKNKGGMFGQVFTYGGMLTENIVQAIARDLMVEAMFRVEKAGYPVVLTVHDELVCERDGGDVEEFIRLVAGPVPKWAKGCPVGAEGWSGTRYRK